MEYGPGALMANGPPLCEKENAGVVAVTVKVSINVPGVLAVDRPPCPLLVSRYQRWVSVEPCDNWKDPLPEVKKEFAWVKSVSPTATRMWTVEFVVFLTLNELLSRISGLP